MRTAIFAAALLAATHFCSAAPATLIPRGSTWRFLATSVAPTNWHQPAFDDTAWQTGAAQLGYGDGDEQTVLVEDPGDAMPTTYYRRTFFVTNQLAISSLTLQVLADDGAVVHLNGFEAARWNMPAGAAGPQTPAASNLVTNENRFVQRGVSTARLQSGLNTLAVEVHQHPAGFSDCSFDLELAANVPGGPPLVALTRPTNGATFAAGPVLIETTTSDPDGHVAQVSFATNGVHLGVATAEPFSLVWSNPPAGRYALTARAYDDTFSYGYSEIVHIQIGPGNDPARLVRGPYLQCGSATGMVVRWRTDWLSDSVVLCGTNAWLLDHALTNATLTAEHEVPVTGLQPGTAYYYAFGSSSATLGSGEAFQFRTSPTTARPVRIWVIGDSGTADENAAAVRDAYETVSGPQHTDLWLMLGDNAYGDGTDEEYQAAVFGMYTNLLPRTPVWPTLGNHDASDSFTGSPAPYLNIFTLPRNGEAGGVASGTELYYSFDYANIHLVCLDSFLSDRSVNGPMLTWLRQDLAATEKDWIIAFWHHPPYSKGGHDSDSDSLQIEMRERALPILEEYGVDLVFSGHSHVYERSRLIDGHYGHSSQLQSEMVLDASLGRADEGGPYQKPAGGLGARRGAVYAVCGCSGQGGNGIVEQHPVMAVTHGGYGSMILEIDGLRLDATFLRPSLAADDHFTIDKSAPATLPPRLNIAPGANGPAMSWPTARPAFLLEWTDHLPATNWQPTAERVLTNGRRNVVTVPTTGPRRFFQLRAAP